MNVSMAGVGGVRWVASLPHPWVECVRRVLGYDMDWYFTQNTDGVPGLAWRWSRA